MADLTQSRTRYDYRSALGATAITPSDSANLPQTYKAIYVGGTGDVKVVTIAGDTVTFAAVPVGILPVVCTKVFATDTTATNLVGLY